MDTYVGGFSSLLGSEVKTRGCGSPMGTLSPWPLKGIFLVQAVQKGRCPTLQRPNVPAPLFSSIQREFPFLGQGTFVANLDGPLLPGAHHGWKGAVNF